MAMWLVIWDVKKALAAKHPFSDKQSHHGRRVCSVRRIQHVHLHLHSKPCQFSMHLPLMCQTVRKWN